MGVEGAGLRPPLVQSGATVRASRLLRGGRIGPSRSSALQRHVFEHAGAHPGPARIQFGLHLAQRGLWVLQPPLAHPKHDLRDHLLPALVIEWTAHAHYPLASTAMVVRSYHPKQDFTSHPALGDIDASSCLPYSRSNGAHVFHQCVNYYWMHKLALYYRDGVVEGWKVGRPHSNADPQCRSQSQYCLYGDGREVSDCLYAATNHPQIVDGWSALRNPSMDETTPPEPFSANVVRRMWYQDTWYYSVIDGVAVLTESVNPNRYWNTLKSRLSGEGADDIVAQIRQLKLQPASINRHLVSLKRYFAWAVERSAIHRDPAKVVKLVPVVRQPPRHLTDQEENALVAAVTAHGSLRDRVLLILALHTGLRAEERCRLERSNVTIGTCSGHIAIYGKRNKYHEVPLNGTAQAVLGEYLPTLPAHG